MASKNDLTKLVLNLLLWKQDQDVNIFNDRKENCGMIVSRNNYMQYQQKNAEPIVMQETPPFQADDSYEIGLGKCIEILQATDLFAEQIVARWNEYIGPHSIGPHLTK